MDLTSQSCCLHAHLPQYLGDHTHNIPTCQTLISLNHYLLVILLQVVLSLEEKWLEFVFVDLLRFAAIFEFESLGDSGSKDVLAHQSVLREHFSCKLFARTKLGVVQNMKFLLPIFNFAKPSI
jgi:hypothetical protein